MTVKTLALFSFPGGWEWIVILLVALLLFGRRLPDVARSVGKSITEFKKGIRDVKDEIETESRLEPPDSARLERKSPAGTSQSDTTTTSAESSSVPK